MNLKRDYLVFVLSVILVILISGCVQQENVASTEYDENSNEYGVKIQEPLQSATKEGLGTLCSGEEECISFCLNNRGRCEGHCKGNKNELCLIIFPPEDEGKANIEYGNNVEQKENCISNPRPVFTTAFTVNSKISSVTQIGSNALYNPGSQARSYINMKSESSDTNMIPVYAPVDSVLTGVAYAVRNLKSGAKGEYRLNFQVSCEVKYAFDHLADVTDKIKEFAPAVPANNTRTDTSISIPIHAGELVGYTDRNIIGGNWDFVFINIAHEAPHLNPLRWVSDHSNHADCPYNYFVSDLKDEYYALIEKSDDNAVTCGPIVRDISGTIAGYWFKEEANEDHGERFGIYGGKHFVEFVLAKEKGFLFIRDTNPTRIAPRQITTDKSVCYFDSEKNKYVYLKLLSETELGLVTGNGQCPSQFPNEYEVFIR